MLITEPFTNLSPIECLASIMKDLIEESKRMEKVKRFLSTLGETGEIADKVSDLILFHNRVKKNAEARHI